MLKNRLKSILLIEKLAKPDEFFGALEQYKCTDHMEYRLVHIDEGQPVETVDFNPWKEEADEVTSITTIWGSGPNLVRLLDVHKNIRWINALTAGVDRVLQPPFTTYQREGLVVTNMKGVYSEALGEYTAFMMLMHEKGAMRFINQQAQSIWQKQSVGRLSGKTVAIVGFGDIGGQVALKCKLGFNMKVIGVKRDPSAVEEKYRHAVDQVIGIDQISLALSQADYVVSILPLVTDTHHFWTFERFCMMKPSGFFINIGRGVNHKENDLVRAVQEKKIAGCYLDVMEVEPLPTSSPLWKMENVYLTPHSADHTDDMLETAMKSYLSNIERFVKSETLINQVSRSKGY
jgi:phosphoglycerate dehydrogenase-like enzyme